MFGGSVDIAMPNFVGESREIETGCSGGSCSKVFGFLFRCGFLLFLFYLYVLLFLNCRVQNITYYNPPETAFVNTHPISLPIQTIA